MGQCLLCQNAYQDKLSLKQILWGAYADGQLCPACSAKFERIHFEEACPYCGRKQRHNRICLECQRWQTREKVKCPNTALFLYNKAMKVYFERYKFQGDYRLRHLFSKEITAQIDYLTKKQENMIVVPIPLSAERYKQRKFNQVRGLVDEKNTLNVMPLLLKCETTPQSAKTKRERLNTPQSFLINAKVAPNNKNQPILLVDDVYTTGRTLHHAANCLAYSGFENIQSLTLAR